MVDPMNIASPRVGVYPGSFNPPTVAHIAVAVAALEQFDLDRVDLAVSTVALGKDDVLVPSLDDRVEVIAASVADVAGVEVVVTERQLVADIADGYDVVIMGADKWAQVNDVVWYDSPAARDAALAALPELALVSRAGVEVPDGHALVVADEYADVSSTAVRAGRREWMTDAARAFGARHRVWGFGD